MLMKELAMVMVIAAGMVIEVSNYATQSCLFCVIYGEVGTSKVNSGYSKLNLAMKHVAWHCVLNIQTRFLILSAALLLYSSCHCLPFFLALVITQNLK